MITRALALCLFAALTSSAVAQPTPLKWGADTDGGVPYVFADPENPNKVIGFEVDLAEALAREIGRPIEFTLAKFENLLPSLDRGDIDLSPANGHSIFCPERLEGYRRSTKLLSGTSFSTSSSATARIRTSMRSRRRRS